MKIERMSPAEKARDAKSNIEDTQRMEEMKNHLQSISERDNFIKLKEIGKTLDSIDSKTAPNTDAISPSVQGANPIKNNLVPNRDPEIFDKILEVFNRNFSNMLSALRNIQGPTISINEGVEDDIGNLSKVALDTNKLEIDAAKAKNQTDFLVEGKEEENKSIALQTNTLLEQILKAMAGDAAKKEEEDGSEVADAVKSGLRGILAGGAGGMLAKGFSGIGATAGKIGSKLKAGGKVLGKIALPLTALFAGVDFFDGFEHSIEITGRDEFRDKLQAGFAKVVSGLSFGFLDAKLVSKAFDDFAVVFQDMLSDPLGVLTDAFKFSWMNIKESASMLKDFVFESPTFEGIKNDFLDFKDKTISFIIDTSKTVGNAILDGFVSLLAAIPGISFFDKADIKAKVIQASKMLKDMFIFQTGSLIDIFSANSFSEIGDVVLERIGQVKDAFIDRIFTPVKEIVHDGINTVEEAIFEFFDNPIAFMKEVGHIALGGVSTALNNMSFNLISKEEIKTNILNVGEKMVDIIISPIRMIKDFILESPLGGLITDSVAALIPFDIVSMDDIKRGVAEMKDKVKGLFTNTWKNIKSSIFGNKDEKINSIIPLEDIDAESEKSQIGEKLKTRIEEMKEMMKSPVEAVKGIFGEIKSSLGESLSNLKEGGADGQINIKRGESTPDIEIKENDRIIVEAPEISFVPMDTKKIEQSPEMVEAVSIEQKRISAERADQNKKPIEKTNNTSVVQQNNSTIVPVADLSATSQDPVWDRYSIKY